MVPNLTLGNFYACAFVSRILNFFSFIDESAADSNNNDEEDDNPIIGDADVGPAGEHLFAGLFSRGVVSTCLLSLRSRQVAAVAAAAARLQEAIAANAISCSANGRWFECCSSTARNSGCASGQRCTFAGMLGGLFGWP